MTIQSPQYMLMETFSSSLTYAQEIIEDKESHEELQEMVTKFLNDASKLNDVLKKKIEVKTLLKEISEIRY